MLERFHQLRRWAGVDRAVFFSNAGTLTRLFTGPITILLMIRCLTPEIQGYYYAFSSVVATQVFLELGLSQNILQFAAFEYAKLHWIGGQHLEGDPVARSRLISLGRMAFGYYAVAALIFLLAIGIGGRLFLEISSDRFNSGSFRDLPAFAARLQHQSDPPARFVYEHLSQQTLLALQNYLADQSKPAPLQGGLSDDLNRITKDESLYGVLHTAGVEFGADTIYLQSQQPHGRQLIHLNRRLMEDAFPRELVRNNVAWQGAWWLIALTTALALAINPAWSLLQGCDQVAVVARFRFWNALVYFGGNALALIAGAGIYASAIGGALTLLCSIAYLFWRWWPFFRQMLEPPRHGRVSWTHEIWPFQWRIALSWVSGYFVFELVNPLAFYSCGPVVAGRLSMSLSMVKMLAQGAETWINTKTPRFGTLIARRSWRELDALWRRSTIQVFSFFLLGGAVFLAAVSLMNHLSFLPAIPLVGPALARFPARLAPFAVNVLLGAAHGAQVMINCMAAQIRAHKKEPFWWLALVTATLSFTLMASLVRVWGIAGEAAGYALAIWGTLLPVWMIYRAKRTEYRAEADASEGAQSPLPASLPRLTGSELP